MSAEKEQGAAITYVGHATTMISLDGVSILTDPWFTQTFLFFRRRRSPVLNHPLLHHPRMVTITHGHPDHFSMESLSTISKEAIVILPGDLRNTVCRLGFKEVRALKAGEKTSVDGIEIEALLTPHRFSRCLGYLFKGSRTIYFPGDLGPSSHYCTLLKDMPHIDCALLPAGGFARGPAFLRNHLSVRELGDVVSLIKPRMVIPVHWGHNPILPTARAYEGTGEKLKNTLQGIDPDITTVVLSEGETCELP